MAIETSNPVYVPTQILEAAWSNLQAAPKTSAALELIVVRPAGDQRVMLSSAELSPQYGLHGDNWSRGCWKTLADGSPDPTVQLTLMSTRLARLVMGADPAHWALAGDQLYADLDLSYDNLPVGQRLAVGSAVLEITAELHKGCAKYQQRFGPDALRFISSPAGKRLNLRGIYAQVVQAGRIAIGDTVHKI